MNVESLKSSLSSYYEQLQTVELALAASSNPEEKESLTNLQNDFKQLIKLTLESIESLRKSDHEIEQEETSDDDPLSSEYALFMSEIKNEENNTPNKLLQRSVEQDLKSLEGMKCRAPHIHQWGDTIYHNAMISSVVSSSDSDYNDITVRVLFINPTHQEMLPCPYFLETECKFSEEKCKFSHGELVSFSKLQEYVEPKFEFLKMGSPVLAKQKTKLWQRGMVKKIGAEKCIVKFDINRIDVELDFHDVLPLDNDEGDEEFKCGGKLVISDNDLEDEDVINMSLLNTPTNKMLGDWEKHTKGIGSKLMQKMGYVVGTGLGRHCDGRLEPVTAVILPAGKSLDHCMHLRENAGNDKDLFSVEKRLLKNQRKQELRNQKIYEQEKNKIDLFNFLNDTLSVKSSDNSLALFSKNKHRQDIRKESSRDLNVASLKIDEDIKRLERDLYKINDSLKRHTDIKSQMYKSLKTKLIQKEEELKNLKAKAVNIKNEQNNRQDKKKLTVF